MKSVGIIGAGITGLTTAFCLQKRGVPVTVYEASGRVGGAIRSVYQDGYLADFGPTTILETTRKIAGLFTDAGLDGRKLYSSEAAKNRYIVCNGRPVAVPDTPVKFFLSPLFSLKTKLRLLIEPFIPPRRDEHEESVAEFVLRRLGREFLERAIDPLVSGIYAGDPYKLSVPQAFPRLHALEQRYGSLIKGQILGAKERKQRDEIPKMLAPKVSFDFGLSVLTETLAAKLGDAVQLNSAVKAIAREGDTWHVEFIRNGTRVRAEHSAIVFAGTAYALAELELRAPERIDLSQFAKINYPPVASVVLGFRREDVEHPLDGYGVLVPRIEGLKILGTLFSSSLYPNRAPDGHVTLTTYLGGARAPELALRPEHELVEITLHDLARVLGVKGRPTFQQCMVYPKAIPQYELGYGVFRAKLTEIETSAPGLFFAGHYRDGISVGDSD
ncbi:MAG: protoporphyrinogen oxidase [Verrucomicrobiae bacterium]|nr:protoporphyrinogen oxidase [Verrucomicrobiae bacterium]